MTSDKRLTRTKAVHMATGEPIEAYEIHIGRSDGPARASPFAMVQDHPEGAVSPDGLVMGSYLHGMFSSDAFRAAFLAELGIKTQLRDHGAEVEATLNALAAYIETHLDVAGLLGLARG